MVQITLLSTELNGATRQILSNQLDSDERARASRYVRAEDADRYLVARTALRRLLAERLGVAPREVRLAARAQGKPVLAHPLGDAAGPVHFNVSHAGHWAAVALADREVGVDVEAVRVLDTRALAANLFDETICADLAGARDPGPRFFEYWTRCEALAKAHGLGLSHFVDAHRRVAPAALVHVAAFAVAPDYRAAVCVLDAQGAPQPVNPHIVYRSAAQLCTGSWT